MVIDTAYLYTLHNAPHASPSLRDVAEQLLGLKLQNIHDSVQDSQVAFYAAAKLLIAGPQRAVVRRSSGAGAAAATTVTSASGAAVTLASLFVHRVPDFCSEEHLQEMLVAYTNIVPVKINPIMRPHNNAPQQPPQQGAVPSGKTTVLFSTQAHADLAFDSIAGPDRPDKQGRSQKRVYLKNGGYICVRK